MPFFPSTTPAFLSRLAPSLLLAGTLFLTACPDNHIGRPCDLGVSSVMNTKVTTVNPAALECPSRVCILPAQDMTTDTGPLCTAECGNDDDCADGEIGAASGDPRCNRGFVCRKIIPRLENNPLSCKSVCVCKDFILTDDLNDSSAPPSCR